MRREAAEGKQSGRTQEIQRLIGRSLRAVADLEALGERTIKIDCDVLQADGGTRCASITGACVALADAIAWCRERGLVAGDPLREFVAAVSVGVVDGVPVLDLDYAEDSACDTDMNVVMTAPAASSKCRARPRARRSRAPRWMRWSGSPSAASARSSLRRRRRSAADAARDRPCRSPPTRPRVRQRRQAARVPPAAGAARHRRRRAGRARHRRSGRAARDVRRERARQGAARERAREAARARRRFRHLRARAGRRARRAERALCGRAQVRRAQQREADRGARRRGRPPRALRVRARAAAPRATIPSRSSPRARGTGRSSTSRAAPAASATTRTSSMRRPGLTAAELPLERKNELSHRGKAMRALIARLMTESGSATPERDGDGIR